MSKKDVFYAGYKYGQLLYGLETGAITEKDLRSEYTRMRSVVVKRISRIQKSKEDIGFLPGKTPSFEKLSNITDIDTLAHEFYNLSRFYMAKSGTVKGRVEQRKLAVQALHEHGLTFVTIENYRLWREFYAWYKVSEFADFYDSTSKAFEEVFKMGGATPAEWARNFENYMRAEGRGDELDKYRAAKNAKPRIWTHNVYGG